MAYNGKELNDCNLPFRFKVTTDYDLILLPRVDFIYDRDYCKEVYRIVEQDLIEEFESNDEFRCLTEDRSLLRKFKTAQRFAWYWVLWKHSCLAEKPLTVVQIQKKDEVGDDIMLLIAIYLLRLYCGSKYRKAEEYDDFERVVLGRPKPVPEPLLHLEKRSKRSVLQSRNLCQYHVRVFGGQLVSKRTASRF